MAKAKDEGIPLGEYLEHIKLYEQPEPSVRAQLDRGELLYTFIDNKGHKRASDDGGELPDPGWWLLPSTKIDYERHSVQGRRYPPFFPPMFLVRVFPTAAPKAKAERRPGKKFDLVLKILADIKPARGLQPAEIEKKVLPVFRREWIKLKPDDKREPPVSRTVINRAYQTFLEDRSGK